MPALSIPNRHVKPENEKKIKLIAMYLILLEEGNVYDYELDLRFDNPSDRRTFERYARELYEAGAIPKPYIKTKTTENGRHLYYYDFPEVKLYPLQTERQEYDDRLQIWLPLINPHKPIAENEYMKTHHFLYHKNKPTSKRLARVLAMIYSFLTTLNGMELESGVTREEKYYFEVLNPGSSIKTWQRDQDLYLYAVFYYKFGLKEIKKRRFRSPVSYQD